MTAPTPTNQGTAAPPRHPSRPLRGAGSAGCGRDGRGPPRARRAARAGGGGQGPGPRLRERPRTPSAFRAGGEGRRRPQPPQPPHRLRHGPARRQPVRGVRAAGGHDAAAGGRARRPPPTQSRGLRGPDRAGPGRGPRQGDRPPGSQAREPLRHQGRAGEDPGFRPRQAPAGVRSARSPRRGRDDFHRDRGGRRPRHRRLHVARAGPRGSRGPSLRHLRLRVGVPRDAVGRAAVQG